MIHLRQLHLIALLGGMIAVQGCLNSDSSPSSPDSETALDEEAIQAVLFEGQGFNHTGKRLGNLLFDCLGQDLCIKVLPGLNSGVRQDLLFLFTSSPQEAKKNQ